MTLSIRARLTAWYTLVVVTVLIAGAAAVALTQQRLGLSRLDGELQRLMLTLEGVMRTEFGEGLDLQGAADEASSEVVAPDRTLFLTREDGSILAIWGRPLPAAWKPGAGTARIETILLSHQRFRVFSHTVNFKHHRYVAAVMASMDGLQQEQRELWLALAIGIAVALGVAAVGGWVVGRQSLRPLTDLAGQTSSITGRNTSTRLHVRNTGDELGRFAQAFNGLLDRLASALDAQRQFMADASHELRTPVSVVRTTAQVTLARDTRSEADYRESLTIVEEQSTRLSRLVDAMFLLSRAEAAGIPVLREPLYLDDLVGECARALRVVSEQRGVELRTSGDEEVQASGDDGLLRQMVSNLVENAIRYARPRGVVTIVVKRAATGATITVTDDGPGIPPDQQSRIFDRFVRLDTRSGGAGLGLPIARWIAEAHGGTLVLEFSSTSGSCFTVTLPT